MIYLIVIINLIINLFLYQFSDLRDTKYGEEFSDDSGNGFNLGREHTISRFWFAFMGICPCIFFYFIIKWLFKVHEKEAEEKRMKVEYRKKVWQKNKGRNRRK